MSARRCCAPGSAIARSAGRWRRFHASGVGSRVRVASTLSRLASVPRSSFLTSRGAAHRLAVERLPPLPGVADIKSEWPRSDRNQWPTSFRNRRPTSPGICSRAVLRRASSYLNASESAFLAGRGIIWLPEVNYTEKNAGAESQARYYFVEAEQRSLVVIGPFDSPAHFRDHGTGQVACRGKLQPVCVDRTSKKDQGVASNRRSLCLGEVGCEPDCPIIG